MRVSMRAPRHPCVHPGCHVLVKAGHAFCEKHGGWEGDQRPNGYRRGNDSAWRRLRAAHLASHPHCVACLAQGKHTQATDVDHVRAHQGDDSLRLDPANLQSLCHPHHASKTARLDGGFGNAPKAV